VVAGQEMAMTGWRKPLGAVVLAAVLLLVSCSAGDDHALQRGTSDPQRGGVLTIVAQQKSFQHLDPQRNYLGEDMAFASSFLHRTLNSYAYSADAGRATELVPDLATDTGTPNADATSWSWTLKDGLRWEDGSSLTCADVKYGVSRSYATDVITDGPTYAITMLAVPTDTDGNSVYKGPYTVKGNDTAAFDRAVLCDGRTITFKLNRPVADFNHTVTLLCFSPVPKAADTGEKYDDHPMSSGPYKFQEYEKGAKLVLDRNDNWSPASDEHRGAYPDKVVVQLGLDPSVIDQRMMQDSGEDQHSVPWDALQPTSLSTVFGSDRFDDRRVEQFGPYVYYLVINAATVPNLDHRRAIAAALDRGLLRRIEGGRYAGDLADGVIKPILPRDYAPSGMWESLLGEPVPAHGNPDLPRRLIRRSGEPMKTLRYDYPQQPTNDKTAAAVVTSLNRVGIKVTLNPIGYEQFLAIVSDPDREGDLVWSAWGPDWPSASTIIPELFTPSGSYNLSRADDASFTDSVAAAMAVTDRDAQGRLWQQLNTEAMGRAWVVPLRFGRTQRLVGSKVMAASGRSGRVYLWAPYGSLSYGDLYLIR
jgi:peptide/nickel transport system substrate-binding protein